MNYFDTKKTKKVTKQKVDVLKAVDLIKPIETGMNKAPKGERTKNKITKGL